MYDGRSSTRAPERPWTSYRAKCSSRIVRTDTHALYHYLEFKKFDPQGSHGPRTRLFDLSQDPRESTDLLASEAKPELARLQQSLAELVPGFYDAAVRFDQMPAVSAETEAQLRALGYVE